VRFLFDFDLIKFLGSEKMIILSKSNLVDEGIDLDQLMADLNIQDLEIFPMNNQSKNGVKELEETLINRHEKIQKVFLTVS